MRAASSSCDGLADGWARRLADHRPVRADTVTRGEGPFYCPACHLEVVLRKGAERADHFAHPAELPSPCGGEEGALHRACKQELLAALAAQEPGGRWEVERVIPRSATHGVPELRPDLSGRIAGCPVAIEVQASALAITEILLRTRAYAQRGIHVLWLVPVHEQLPDDALRPRLHERYFHSMYLGRTYYWWPGLGGTVLPVHYGTSTRPIAYSEWFRPGAGRLHAGGYEAPYRSIRLPLCGPRLRIGSDFSPQERPAFTPANERKAVPACRLWLDRLQPWW